MKSKNGQIWIETVVYTLIGLGLIALTLAYITPKINESKDNAIVEQTIDSLSVINEQVISVLETGQSNSRKSEITIKKGTMYINPTDAEIYIVLENLKKPYSEVGSSIEIVNNIKIITEESQKGYTTTLKLDYSNSAIMTYEGSQEQAEFPASPTSYKILVSNNGYESGKTKIGITRL